MHEDYHDYQGFIRALAFVNLLLLIFSLCACRMQSAEIRIEEPKEAEQKKPIYVTQVETLEIIPLKTEAAPETTISEPTEETTPATEAATIATEPPTEAVTEETTTPTEPSVEETVEEETIPTETAYPYTEEELEYLSLVIYQEAGGDRCSDETRLMVGTVVMNRVEDDRFPDTIREVILQRGQYGRLYWTGPTWPARRWNKGEAHAVERAYAIAERILNGERAFGKDVVFQAEFVQGKIVAHQDGFYFCR